MSSPTNARHRVVRTASAPAVDAHIVARLVHRVAVVLRLGRVRAFWLRHRGAVVRRLPDLVLAVGLLINGAVLLAHSDGIWFWADDWDLLFMRGAVPEFDQGLLAPHNNHWLTAHALIYRVLFDLFGIASYTPFAVTAILFHLATVVMLRLVVRRAGAGAWVATMTALMLAFFGIGANAQIPSASLNHVGALLCGLIAALVVARAKTFGRRQILWCALPLMISLTFGLTSLALLVFVGSFVALQHGVRKAFFTLLPPGILFAAWWLAYGRDSGINSISPEFDLLANLPGVPAYMWTGITGTLGDGSGLTGAGPLLAGVIIISLLAPASEAARPPAMLVKLAWAGVIAALFQLLVVSIARFDFGASQIGNSHYAYINLVLLSPGIALVATRLVMWSPLPRWALGALVAFVFVAYALNGVTWIRQWQQNFQFVTATSDDLAFGIKQALVNEQEVLNWKNPDPFNKGLSPLYISAPRVMNALGDHKPTPGGLLTADTMFFSAVDEEDHGLARPPEDLRTVNMQPIRQAPGCQVVKATGPAPTIRLTTGDEGNEIVVWSNSDKVTLHLERDGVVGPNREFTVEPGPVHVATSAPNAEVYATFNGTGDFNVCQA